ncbi:MAG: YegP family protein [Candidatus Latescibacterota bacterium]|jgi:hypothetical protein
MAEVKNPKFELYKTKAGKFRFRLYAVNGQIILTSQSYASKATAKKGIASVQKNAASEAQFERGTAKNGQLYFNLIAANKQVVGTSQMYASKATCTNGIKAVMRDAPKAGILDSVK